MKVIRVKLFYILELLICYDKFYLLLFQNFAKKIHFYTWLVFCLAKAVTHCSKASKVHWKSIEKGFLNIFIIINYISALFDNTCGRRNSFFLSQYVKKLICLPVQKWKSFREKFRSSKRSFKCQLHTSRN